MEWDGRGCRGMGREPGVHVAADHGVENGRGHGEPVDGDVKVEGREGVQDPGEHPHEDGEVELVGEPADHEDGHDEDHHLHHLAQSIRH